MLLLNIKDTKYNRPMTTIPRGLPKCSTHKNTNQDVFPWDITPHSP